MFPPESPHDTAMMNPLSLDTLSIPAKENLNPGISESGIYQADTFRAIPIVRMLIDDPRHVELEQDRPQLREKASLS